MYENNNKESLKFGGFGALGTGWLFNKDTVCVSW